MSIQSEINRLATIKAELKSAINGAAGSVVGDVFADYPAAIVSGKASIAAAITDKGVQTAADATFQQMATNIGNILSGIPGLSRVNELSFVENIANGHSSFLQAGDLTLIPVLNGYQQGLEGYTIYGSSSLEQFDVYFDANFISIHSSSDLIEIYLLDSGSISYGASIFSEDNVKFFIS